MKMRTAAAAIVLLTFVTLGAGRAGAQDLSPQGKAAGAAYFQCLRREARAVDDGKSEASTIALGVVSQCRASIGAYALVSSHGSFDVQKNVMDGAEQRAVADATAAVLVIRERNERRRARRAYLARIWHAATGRKQ